jgi:hypothetical protein
MSPEDLKAWTEFREATGHAPLSDLLAAWKDRQTSDLRGFWDIFD